MPKAMKATPRSADTRHLERRSPHHRLTLAAADRGGTLVNDTFLGWNVHHTFRDSQGREWKALPGNILKGKWSPYESGRMSRDQWHVEIQEIARNRGGKLLEVFK